MTTYKVDSLVFDKTEQAETWALVDTYGREVGYRITTYVVEWEIKEIPQDWGYDLETAEKHLEEFKALGPYVLRTQQLRNGRSFGPGGRACYFHTVEARDKAIKKYIRDAKLRVIKAVEKKRVANLKKTIGNLAYI